ncbi:hypothetical protein GOB57_24540 [Sinorhizobium meliloti]|nr:hypothetical protein [Sinorhizobium meliloti]
MTFEIDYDGMRKLAKALSARTNREIKLTDIYNDIGSVFGMNGDAMMHLLKSERSRRDRRKGCGPVSEGDPLHWLLSPKEFLDAMLREMDGRTSWKASICVVHLESYEAVKATSGEAEGLRHLRAFATQMRPKPYSDAIFAYLGETFFVAGWPGLDLDVDPERRILDRFQCWDRNLGPAGGLDGKPTPFDFTGVADFFESRSITRQRIEKAIERCRPKAVRLAAARKELSAFPRLKFVF